MDSSDLRRRSPRELAELAAARGVEGAATMRRAELVVALLQVAARSGDELTGDGVLEITDDGFGFLRSPHLSYQPGADDVYVSPSQIRRFELRTGDTVAGVVRPPKEGERFVALLKVAAVNGRSPDGRRPSPDFQDLEVAAPTRSLPLASDAPWVRAVDVLAPLAAGSRVLVLGPAHSGRSALAAALAAALARHDDLSVQLLLVDRPREELAGLAAVAGVERVATTLDEAPTRHGQVAELALARAERMAESGSHVVLVIDSLTRLGHALHAALVRPAGTVDPGALHRIRRLFAAGRALAAGGSLTVVAVAREASGALDGELVEHLLPAATAIVRLDPTLPDLPLDPHRTRASHVARYLPADQADGHARLCARLAGLRPADATRELAGLLAAHPTRAGLLAAG